MDLAKLDYYSPAALLTDKRPDTLVWTSGVPVGFSHAKTHKSGENIYRAFLPVESNSDVFVSPRHVLSDNRSVGNTSDLLVLTGAVEAYNDQGWLTLMSMYYASSERRWPMKFIVGVRPVEGSGWKRELRVHAVQLGKLEFGLYTLPSQFLAGRNSLSEILDFTSFAGDKKN